MTGRTTRRTLAALLALWCVPWAVLTYPGGVSFVFPWGLFGVSPLSVTSLPAFLFRYTAGLPGYILAWPLGVLTYALATASAAVGVLTGREDPRVTGGLLVVAGATLLSLTRGFSFQPGRTAWPLGTLLLWTVAWWGYGPALRRTVTLVRE